MISKMEKFTIKIIDIVSGKFTTHMMVLIQCMMEVYDRNDYLIGNGDSFMEYVRIIVEVYKPECEQRKLQGFEYIILT